MTPANHVPLGRVVKTHGLKGEVSVAPATDLPFVLPQGLTVWFVPPPARIRTARVESVRQGPKGPLVKLEGIDDIDTASGLCGTQMLADADALPEEWFADDLDDLVGWTVEDEARGALGEIVDVIVTGANDVWVVEGPHGEVLIPVIDDVVVAFDEDAETVRVTLLEGLLPEEAEEA